MSGPIVAVTVFADQARVTRRAVAALVGGEQKIVFDQLPLTLNTDSVRVSGAGAATVLGVDVTLRHQARSTDADIQRLEQQLREAQSAVTAIDDEDAIASQRLEFLAELGRRATRAYASALASGETDPGRVASLADELDAQQSQVRGHKRDLVRRRQEAWDAAAAIERELASRRGRGRPDHYAAVVELRAAAAGEATIELSYVVTGAGWRSAYDVRLDNDELTLSWFGLVTQQTGENWPECELRLSTARPSSAAVVPELLPWFLDRVRPPVPRMMPAAMPAPQAAGMPYGSRQAKEMAFAADEEYIPLLADTGAVLEQGATAATYRPERVVAVPADGNAHRATVAVVQLTAARDYITAPVQAEEAHLRATVTNGSDHTFPMGSAAVFHGGDFVGSTALDVWAPGEEIELALGVDDRVRIERTLVRRTAAKAALGSTRRREAEHRIRVTNHTPGPVTVTVLDQLPVSRDDAITVRELRLDPAPAERTELGVLTWRLALAPAETRDIHVGVRVETAKGAELAGWRE